MKTINYDGKIYKFKKDKYGCYDIYHNNKIIATNISINYIDYTLDLYSMGSWCDICKGEGIIERNDGSCAVCRECSN